MPSNVTVLVNRQALSPVAALRAVTRPDCGGICVFLGTVRDRNEGRRVRKIRYSAFEAMVLRTFRAIAREARKKFGVRAVYMAHRTGMLRLKEASVLVAASAPHRAEAFAGCRHLIERVKKISPIWKEEFHDRGKRWVNRG
jgi:molybdopterin synthase catalytic subunit